MSLDRLFAPSSIAVVGASTDPEKIGYAAMQNASRFDGPVVPVNPNASGTLFDRRFASALADINHDIDLAIVCVPRHVVPEVIEECVETDVGGAVIYAGGFGESGPEGAQLQTQLGDIVADADLSVLGPNTSGFINVHRGVFGSFVEGVEEVAPGNVAVVAQSGGVSHVTMFEAIADGVGLSVAIGLGNRVDVDFPAVIDYLDRDEHTDSIVLHVEGSANARALVERARDVETPVAVYKVGRTDVGEFAASHTGALVGEYDLYQDVFAQYGLSTVDSCQELLDAGHVLAEAPPPRGPNVGLITAQAGPGIAIADRINRVGGTLPDLTAETDERIADIVPDITYGRNPVDIGHQDPRFDDVIDAVARDDNVDILLIYELYEVGYPLSVLERLVGEVGKPIVFATNGPDPEVTEGIEELRARGIPAFRSPERGAQAVAVLVQQALATPDVETAADAEERNDD